MVITQTCDELRSDWDKTTETQPEFTELFFVIKTSRAGAHIKRAHIDYTADGAEYRLTTAWEMLACGSAIRERAVKDWCQPKN